MKLRSEDFEMSPLAGYGLCFIALVLGVLGLEKFAAKEAEIKNKVIAAQTEFATLTAIRDTDYWDERLAQSTESRKQLQSELWQGTTSGVVAAELQQALRSLARNRKFENIQIRVDPKLIEVETVSALSFEFSGRAVSSKILADYFEDLALYSKIIIIEEAYFTQNLQSPRAPVLTMSGLIPVQISSPQTAGGGL